LPSTIRARSGSTVRDRAANHRYHGPAALQTRQSGVVLGPLVAGGQRGL